MRLGQFLILAVAVLALAGVSATHGAEQDLSANARLLLAARNGDAASVERALKAGAAANTRNRLGETPLLIALRRDDLALAQLMLDAGADVNLPAVNGVTPLMAAAFGGHAQMVVALLGKGADVNARDRLKKTAMIYAAGEGRTDVVRILIARGVDANAVYENDLTALMWAAGFGRTATVKALLDAGARADLGTTAASRRWRSPAKTSIRRPPNCSRTPDPARRAAGSGPCPRPSAARASVRPVGDAIRQLSAAGARSPSGRATGRDRGACASAPRRHARRPPRAITQLVARCSVLMRSLSATFLPAQLGSVMPKYLTG